MAKKKKTVIWHKKSGKLLPSSALKPHGSLPQAPDEAPTTGNSVEERRKVFAQKLSIQIKKAVRGQI